MTIPSAPDLMRPILTAHEDGARLRLEDLATRVAPTVGVSEDERTQRQPSGDYVFTQRVGWARIYLEQLGLLNRVIPGEMQITDAGRSLLRASSAPATASAFFDVRTG